MTMIRKQWGVWAAGFLGAAVAAGAAGMAHAATKYWDVNGTTTGSSIAGFVDEDWTADRLNWNTDPTGGAGGTITTFSPGDDAVFSAGTDAVDGIILSPGASPTNQQQPNSITIEEGQIQFSTANTFNMQANTSVRVNEGATLQIPNLNVFTINGANVSVTLDGGTFRNTIVGVGSGIFSNPAANPTKFLLTSKGGTIDTPNGGNDNVNGAYSIMLYGTAAAPSIIGMTDGTTSSTLRKTGHGEFRAGKDWTFTNLIVEEGLYRINGDGGLDSGFGAANGTVTTMGGAEANTTNGSALGTSASIVSPATRSFVLGGTGDTMFVTNATLRIDGPVSGPGGLMLNGWVRNDTGAVLGTQTTSLVLGGTNTYAGPTTINYGTLTTAGGSAIPDTSRVTIATQSEWGKAPAVPTVLNTAVLGIGANETVGSIAGGSATRGSINISGAAITLTTGADNTSSTYDGAITGAGSLKKIGTGTFNINGAKTYTGNTTVEGGVLSTNSASLADAADVYLKTGGIFNLNFAGTDVIDSLFINGVSQAIGTWGGVGSGAANISALLSGTGLLQVSTLASIGLPGDFNGNLVVDAADYTVWRDHLGAPDESSLNGNGNGSGGVDQADYDLWKTNFGHTPGSGALGAAAVPEPATCLLLVLAGVCVAGRVRR
jgi:autotransporter-associated beta strand protein